MRNLRRIGGLVTAILVIPLAIAGGLLLFAQTGAGRAMLAWTIETMASSEGRTIGIGEMSGRIPFDVTLRDVTLSDGDGAWLTIDRARLAWRPFALAAGRLSIETLEADRIDLERLPPSSGADEGGGGIPRLPFEIVLERLAVEGLALGEPVLGTAATVSVAGEARLGDPADGLSARIGIARIDGIPGTIEAQLGYRPDDTHLHLDISVDEPAGGLVSRLAGMPGLPPLHLEVSGSGPIDDWAADLSLKAGDQAEASGTAMISAVDGGQVIAVDLSGDLAGLVQPAYVPLLEGRSTLAARALLGAEGQIGVESAEILAAAGWVSVAGTVNTRSGALGLTYEIVAGEARRYSAIMPVEASWHGIEVTGTIGGTLAEPDVTAALLGEEIAVAGNGVRSVALSVSAEARGPLGEADSPIALTASGRADGLALAEEAYSRAAGTSATLDLTGTVTPAGRFDAENLRLDLGGGSIVWTGLVEPDGFDGRVAASNVDLSTFAAAAGLDLRGTAELEATVAGRFDGSALAAQIEGGASGFASGVAAVDGALGPRFTVSGGVERNADGSFAFDDLVVAGEALQVRADGAADESRADVTADIDLTDLSRLDDRVTGSAQARVRLTGSLEELAAELAVTIDEATAMGRPVAGLKLGIEAQDVTKSPTGTLSMSGTVDGRPVSGSGRLAQQAGGGLKVDGLDVAIGSVRLSGDVAVDGEGRAAGRIAMAAADLADMSSLALTELTGTVDAVVELAVENGVQVARVEGTARDVRAYDVRVGSADMRAKVRDPAGRLVVDADVSARGLEAGGQRIDELKVTAQGGADENTVSVSARGLGASLEARGAVALAGGETTIRLADLRLTGGGQSGTLAGPATISISGGDTTIDGLRLTSGSGRLEVAGRAGETLDLSVTVQSLPLSLAEIAMAGTGISGTVSGSARLTGPAAAPAGEYRLNIAGLSVPAMRQAGLRPLDIAASGQLAGGRAGIDARVTGEAGAALTVTGSVPMSASGALDVGLSGRIDLALLNDMLAASGDRVAGPVDIDLKITGRADRPEAAGTIRLAGGSYSSPLNGVSLDSIAMEARGSLNAIEISRFSARAPNGGTISGSGQVRLDPGAGFPVDMRISADNAGIISNELVDAVVDAVLTLTGPAATGPALAGTVTVRQMDITLPERLPRSVTAIAVEHVNAPAALQAQFAEQRRTESAAGGAAYAMALDLTVTTTNRIFVRGLGVDAQLGGEVRVRGTSRTPIVLGGFELRRGSVEIIGQRLNLTRGIVTFPGTEKIDPELDLVAETTTSSVTARVAVTGRASSPVFRFSSSPELPQDEVLARILFDKATGQLSAGEAVQLAQAAAQIAGLGGNGGLLDDIRKNLGLDVLQVTTSGDDPALGVGRYINDNIYLGVRQGVRPNSSRVTVDIEVTDNIKARGEVGADGSSSVGINMEWDY